MRKLRFLFVLLAMVSLASCNYEDEAVIRYEGKLSGIDYEAKIFQEIIDVRNSELFFKDTCLTNPKSNTSRREFLAGLNHLLSNDEIVHIIRMPHENTSYTINFKEEVCMNNNLYEQIMYDFVKNTGINSDTAFKASYRLVVYDKMKFDETTRNAGDFETFRTRVFLNTNEYYSTIAYYKNSQTEEYIKLKVLEIDMHRFLINLRTSHGIPVLLENDSINKDIIINLKPEFYSGQKSVEEVNEMLSEYGLSLEPTGEEMMVVTFSIDKPIESAKLFESKSYTKKFFALLFVGILFCVFATMHVSKKEALAPKSKSIIRVGSAILLWVLAALCLFIFFMFFTEEMQSALHNAFFNIHLINSVSLITLSYVFILIATGISVFNYRKSYYTILGKILRVIFTIVVFCIMYTLVKIIINSDLHSYLLTLSICLIAMVMNIFALRIRRL